MNPSLAHTNTTSQEPKAETYMESGAGSMSSLTYSILTKESTIALKAVSKNGITLDGTITSSGGAIIQKDTAYSGILMLNMSSFTLLPSTNAQEALPSSESLVHIRTLGETTITLDSLDPQSGQGAYTAHGSIQLKGITTALTFPIILLHESDGEVRLQGTIELPSQVIALFNVSNAEKAMLTFSIVAQ